MLTLLLVLNLSSLGSCPGDHRIALYSFTFTNAVKYKIEIFKSDFLPAHNRKKQVVVFFSEGEMKTEHKGLGGRELGGEERRGEGFVLSSPTVSLERAPRDHSLFYHLSFRPASSVHPLGPRVLHDLIQTQQCQGIINLFHPTAKRPTCPEG